MGASTSFFNSNNFNIVKDLIQLLNDNKQVVPDWLLDFGREAFHNNKRKAMKKKMPHHNKDWRKYNNNFGSNNLYTGPKVYQYNHTTTTNHSTSLTNRNPNPTNYW